MKTIQEAEARALEVLKEMENHARRLRDLPHSFFNELEKTELSDTQKCAVGILFIKGMHKIEKEYSE